MAMNIPAPVQILRYNVPEGTTLSAFYSYITETITPGAFIFATGRVINDGPKSLDNAREIIYVPIYALYVGIENSSVPYVVIPIAGSNVETNELYNGIYTCHAPFIHDVIGDDGFRSSLRYRGYLGESASNIDTIEFSGIYRPGYGSTLPEEVTNMDNAKVLHYGDRSPRYQICLYFDSTLPTASRTVKIYTRVSYESVLSGPEDWSPWQPLGGGSSLTAGEPYATAPSTRSTPASNEIITYDFLSTRYLPISGGTLTGGLFGTSVALSGNSIDVSQGSCFTKTITAATTFAFTGVPSNTTARFSLVLTNGGSQTVTWPSSVKWSGGVNPELAASGVDVFTFLTVDGGTTWYGVHSVQGAA